MDARLYDRLAAAMSVVFLLALGAGTYYLAAWATRDISPAIQLRTNEPDVFVEGVSLTRVDNSGDPVFQMSAGSMRHFPFDGSSEFLEPRLTSLDPRRPKVTVRADRAVATKEGSQTILTGNVVLRRRTGDERPILTVRTERLTLISDNETAKTDAPVVIEQGSARLTASGMEFDNLSHNLKLLSRVRGIWPESSNSRSSSSNSLSATQ